jgi:hypothetical protein
MSNSLSSSQIQVIVQVIEVIVDVIYLSSSATTAISITIITSTTAGIHITLSCWSIMRAWSRTAADVIAAAVVGTAAVDAVSTSIVYI